MKSYSFLQCNLTKLDQTFGLRKVFASQALEQWLQMQVTLSDFEKEMLTVFQQLLIENVDGWNENELALNFIGPLFGLAHFTEPYRFNFFSERKIGAIIPGVNGDVELMGKPDGMIATGYREPEIPMFAFSEFKRQLASDGDPAAQTLAAMLVGQHLDAREKPLYGCYVVGHDWRFMVLEGKHYMVSHDFSSITNEIFDIFRILKALKKIVIELTA